MSVSGSEIDSEFEKFMQASLTTNGTSITLFDSKGESASFSQSRAEGFEASQNAFNVNSGASWLKASAVEEPNIHAVTLNTKEVEKAGHETSTGTISTSHEEFSRDSLEASNNDSTKHIGRETMEELEDKMQFFTALEKEKDAEIDYEKLNRELTMTETFSALPANIAESDNIAAKRNSISSTVSSTVTYESDFTDAQDDMDVLDSNVDEKRMASYTGGSTSHGSSTPSDTESSESGSEVPRSLVSAAGGPGDQAVPVTEDSSTAKNVPVTEDSSTAKNVPVTEDSSRALSSSENRGFDLSPIHVVSPSLPGQDYMHRNSGTSAVETPSKVQVEDIPSKPPIPPIPVGVFSEVLRMPSQPMHKSSKVPDTPSKVLDTPSKVLDTPSKVLDTPSKVLDTPSKVLDTPSKVLDMPTKIKEKDTPSQLVDIPSKVHSAPYNDKSAVSLTEGDVSLSESTTDQVNESLQQDLEEVQAALKAAGLPGFSEEELSPDESMDVEEVMKDMAREELMSMTKSLIEEHMAAKGKVEPSPQLASPSDSVTGKPNKISPKESVKTQGPSLAKSALKRIHKQTVTSSSVKAGQKTSNGSATRKVTQPVRRAVQSAKKTLPSLPSRMQREEKEQELVKELDQLKIALEEEICQHQSTKEKCATRERELIQKEESLKLHHREEVHHLKKEIFSLAAKLRDNNRMNESECNHETLKETEKEQFEKELQSQEKLLADYQRENEKIYCDLQKCQKELKTTRERLSEENRHLKIELANERAKSERKSERLLGDSVVVSEVSPSMEHLEGNLEQSRHENTKLVSKVAQLEQMISVYERDLRSVTSERDSLKEHLHFTVPNQELTRLRETHKEEVRELERKLKWFAENQRLLDQDAEVLRAKDREIEELRVKLEEASENTLKQKEITKERVSDARRIRDLERQIKEMETIIQRRFPNSITAMIYATSHEDEKKSEPKRDAGQPLPSALYLERRVRKLENELEEKDKEHSRKVRTLQQQYTAMEFQNEAELKKVRQQLEEYQRLSSSLQRATHPHTTVQALQRELEKTKLIHQTKMAELRQELGNLKKKSSRDSDQNRIRDRTNQPNQEVRTTPSRPLKEGSGGEYEAAIKGLEQELIMKKKEWSRMKRERDSFAKAVDQLRDQLEKRENSDPSQFHSKEVESLVTENNGLRQQVSQLQLEMAHHRVQYQSDIAQVETTRRETEEQLQEKIKSICEEHKKEIEDLMAKYVQTQSKSAVLKLKSKLANHEVQIFHLKEQLEAAKLDSDALVSSKLREKHLEDQLKKIALELVEAKRYHSPEMHHYGILLNKITSLESRITELKERRDSELHTGTKPSNRSLHQVEKQWAKRLLEKNAEVETFRVQLDDILSTLETLRLHSLTRPSSITSCNSS